MNREFALPGLVAIALAILYPLYWYSGLFTVSGQSLMEIFRADLMRLSLMDAVYVLIGLMECYVYLSLRRWQQQRLNGALGAALALCMAIGVAMFTALVLFDVFLALGPELSEPILDGVVITATVASLALGWLVSLLGVLLAIVLLVRAGESGLPLILFAVMLLISCLLALTVLLMPLAVLVYPVALVLLAVLFFNSDGEVEVV